MPSLREQLRAKLADGEWHSLHELVLVGLAIIRPEVAIRRYVQHSRRSGKTSAALEHQIIQGTRYIVLDALANIGAIRRGDKQVGGRRLELREYRSPAVLLKRAAK